MFIVYILYCNSRLSYRCFIWSLVPDAKSCKLINILCPVEVTIKVKHIWISPQGWCFGNSFEISFVVAVHCIDLEWCWPHWESGRSRVSAAMSSLQSCRVETHVAFQKLILPSVGSEHFSQSTGYSRENKQESEASKNYSKDVLGQQKHF